MINHATIWEMIDNQLQDDFFSMQRRDNFLEKYQTVLSDS